jgi:hypothetical protein
MDSPVTTTAENVAGRAVGALAALTSLGHGGGGLANFLITRQRLLADPSFRATLTGSPFSAGIFQVGGGAQPGPPIAVPSDLGTVPGTNLLAGLPGAPPIAPPGAMAWQAVPGPSVWQPDLPPLESGQQLKEAAQTGALANLGSSDAFTRVQAKLASGVPLTPDETVIAVSGARQLQGIAGPGSTVNVDVPGMRTVVGSPYALAAMGPGEYTDPKLAQAAADAIGGGAVAIPTGRGTWEVKAPGKQLTPPGQIFQGPAGAGAGTPSTTTTPAEGGPTATIPTRTNNPGSIKDGVFAQSQPGYVGPGPAAADGGRFAVFASPEAGAAALTGLLQTPGYQKLTVDGALHRWSGGGYRGDVAAGVGIDPRRPMSSLNELELGTLAGGIAGREGYAGPLVTPPLVGPTAPTAVAAAPPPAPPPTVAAPSPAPTDTGAQAPTPPPAAPFRLLQRGPQGQLVPVPPPAAPQPPPGPQTATPPAPTGEPVTVASAGVPYRVVPGAELPEGAGGGAPPATGAVVAPTPAVPSVAVPWDTGNAPPPAPTPPTGAPVRPTVAPGTMVPGTYRKTVTTPEGPEEVSGTFGGEPPKQTVSTRGNLRDRIFLQEMGIDPANPPPGAAAMLRDFQIDALRREAETRANVNAQFGNNSQVDTITKLENYRAIVNQLLQQFPTPESRAQFVGAYGLKPALNQLLAPIFPNPAFDQFRTLNAGLRASIFGDAGKQVTGPEIAILSPTLPTGYEVSPDQYEKALSLTVDKLDRLITAYNARGQTTAGDWTPQHEAQFINQYLSGPTAVHYGPVPWTSADQAPGPPPPATAVVPGAVVDRVYTLPSPTAPAPAPGP